MVLSYEQMSSYHVIIENFKKTIVGLKKNTIFATRTRYDGWFIGEY